MDKKNHTEPAQTGFDAISGAARALYPGQEGVYYGTLIPYTLGGGDPLDGVEIWKSERGVPHWHYITYGFTELYEKESGDPDESGYGFELTFRLKRGMEEAPPVWPVTSRKQQRCHHLWCILFHIFFYFWTGTDKGHLSLPDIDQLWKFI